MERDELWLQMMGVGIVCAENQVRRRRNEANQPTRQPGRILGSAAFGRWRKGGRCEETKQDVMRRRRKRRHGCFLFSNPN